MFFLDLFANLALFCILYNYWAQNEMTELD